MTASTSKSEIQTCVDKKGSNFDEKTCRDVDKFPVNFSGVPHIGTKIFEFLGFEDLNNCSDVCKGWQSFLQEKRTLWIELLKKENFMLDCYANYSSNELSDCSDDSLGSDDLWINHINEHDPDNMLYVRGRNPMSQEEVEFNHGYVTYG